MRSPRRKKSRRRKSRRKKSKKKNPAKLVIYTLENCGNCKFVKKKLTTKKIKFIEKKFPKNLKKQKNFKRKIQKISKKSNPIFPVIVLNKKYIGGIEVLNKIKN